MGLMQAALKRSEAYNSRYQITGSSTFTDNLLAVTFAGSSIFGVGSKFAGGESTTAQIVRFNATSGKVMWVNSISGTCTGFSAAVAPFSNGDVAVAIRDTSTGRAEVLRIAADASIVWQRRLVPSGFTIFPETNTWLAIDGSDDVYLLLPQDSIESVNYMKLVGSTGLTSWSRRYESTAVDHNELSCAVTPAGKMIIGGVKGSNDHLLLYINTDGTIDQAVRVNDSGSDLNTTGKGARDIKVGLDGNIYVVWGWNDGARLTKLNSSFTVQWSRHWSGIEFAFRGAITGVEDRLYIMGAEDLGVDDRKWIGVVNSSGAFQAQRYVVGTDSRELVNFIADMTGSFLLLGGSDPFIDAGILLKMLPDFSNEVSGNGIELENAGEFQFNETGPTLTADGGTGSAITVTNTAGSRTLTDESFTTNLLS